MGLAVGASLITACEFVMYLAVRLYVSVTKRSLPNNPESAAVAGKPQQNPDNSANVPSMYI